MVRGGMVETPPVNDTDQFVGRNSNLFEDSLEVGFGFGCHDKGVIVRPLELRTAAHTHGSITPLSKPLS